MNKPGFNKLAPIQSRLPELGEDSPQTLYPSNLRDESLETEKHIARGGVAEKYVTHGHITERHITKPRGWLKAMQLRVAQLTERYITKSCAADRKVHNRTERYVTKSCIADRYVTKSCIADRKVQV